MATYFTNSTQEYLDELAEYCDILDLGAAPTFKPRHRWLFNCDEIAAKAAEECGPLAPNHANIRDQNLYPGDIVITAIPVGDKLTWKAVTII